MSTSAQGVTGEFSLAGLRRMRCRCVLSHEGHVTHDRLRRAKWCHRITAAQRIETTPQRLSLMLNLIHLHCASATFAQSQIVVVVVMAVVVVLQLSEDPEKKLSLLCDSKSLIPATLFLPSTPSMLRFWLMCFLVWRSLHSRYQYPYSSMLAPVPHYTACSLRCFQAALLDTCKFVIPEMAESCGVQLRSARPRIPCPSSPLPVVAGPRCCDFPLCASSLCTPHLVRIHDGCFNLGLLLALLQLPGSLGC